MAAVPFRIDVAQETLERIHRQLREARIGYAPDDDAAWQYGMDARYLGELIAYWRDDYDWRAEEVRLNALPQFKATVEGIDVHFYHIAGEGDHPIPILLTHGWPGSVVEFLEVIPLLSAAGFRLVVPSLPGFGWSGKPARPIGISQVARMWRKLMVDVLGYPRFFAQGGDFGAVVTAQLGLDHQDVVSAIHINLVSAPLPGPELSPAEQEYWAQHRRVTDTEGGYSHEHWTKPQTIGLALHDNPVGWAAWVVEKFQRWADTRGDIESRFSKDQLITNLMSYVATDSVISSIWMYWGLRNQPRTTGRVPVPTAAALYPAEFYPHPSRELANKAYNIVRYQTMPAGGHFAAFEEPKAFAQDVAEYFLGQL